MLCLSGICRAQKTIDEVETEIGTRGTKPPLKELFISDKSKATFKQTSKWISEKMNNYTLYEYREGSNPETLSSYQWADNYKITYSQVTIDSPYMIIDQTVYTEYYIRDQSSSNIITAALGNTTKDSSHFKITILIPDLKEVSYGNNYIEFETFENSISGWGPGNNYKFYINFDKEDNINERLIKAFVHLDKFFWSKVKNETF